MHRLPIVRRRAGLTRACAALLAVVASGWPAREVATGAATPPLSAELLAVWKRGGTQVGWMNKDDRLRENPFGSGGSVFRFGGTRTLGDVPAFRPERWESGMVGHLPAPAVPFGLEFGRSGFTDEWLKELAGFRHLQALSLTSTQVTDAGLHELTALHQLQMLSFDSTSVTDAGLKQLAHLHQLQTLDLSATGWLTDAGLEELAGLEQLRTLYLFKTPVTDADLEDLAALP